MTDQEQYDKAVELAVGMAQVTTREQVKVVTWLPFQILYVEMARRKEIETLMEMDKEMLLKYWTEACIAQPGKPKWKKLWICQSLLIFDLITEKSNQ